MNATNGLMAAATFGVSLIFTFGPGAEHMTLAGALIVSSIAAGAVGLSASRPRIALAVAGIATVAQPTAGVTFAAMDIVLVLVAYQVTTNTTLQPWVLAGIVFVLLTVNDAWQRYGQQLVMEPSMLYPALLTALGVGLGTQSRRVREQNAELLTLRDADRRRAVSDERRRIARDVHDVAAHHLSALVVRNKLARRIDTPLALEDAADFTARTASQALTSLRNVVHVLNADDPSPRSPMPALSDLNEIFERVESAGLDLRRHVADLGCIDQELEMALIRITQEALANVLRHRGPGRCWVELRRDGPDITLIVDDDGGQPTAEPAPGDSRAASRERFGPDAGYGLIGMRERAQARRGQLSVGPSPHGGWRIAAVFPAEVT